MAAVETLSKTSKNDIFDTGNHIDKAIVSRSHNLVKRYNTPEGDQPGS